MSPNSPSSATVMASSSGAASNAALGSTGPPPNLQEGHAVNADTDAASGTGPPARANKTTSGESSRTPPPARRRAALIATALTVPIVIILALAFAGGLGNGGPGKVQAAAPPRVEACDALMAALPDSFQLLKKREVASDSNQVAAWGDPATVLRCGVNRPAALVAGSAAQQFYINDVLWQPEESESGQVDPAKPLIITVVDRDVYIEVTSPNGTRLDATPLISDIIKNVFPDAVCLGQSSGATPLVPDDQLCTRRP